MAKKKPGKKGGKKSNALILAETKSAEREAKAGPADASPSVKKTKASDIVDSKSFNTAIREFLQNPDHGIDKCMASLLRIKAVLPAHHHTIDKIRDVFDAAFAPFKELTDASQVSVKDVGTLIQSLTEASRYVSARAPGFFSKDLYKKKDLPEKILNILSGNIIELIVRLNKISHFHFNKKVIEFYGKFENFKNIDNAITQTKYQYVFSDYCSEAEKPALYRDILDGFLPNLANKDHGLEHGFIILLARFADAERNFDKVKPLFLAALRSNASNTFKDACAIKYARYLLENDRPVAGIRKAINLIKNESIKDLISSLYDYYLAEKEVDLRSLQFPDAASISVTIEAALYTELLRIKVEKLGYYRVEDRVKAIDDCLSDLKRGKETTREEQYSLSPNTRDYIEARIIKACVEYGHIKKGFEALESGLINPLSSDASIMLKTHTIILYILAGMAEKALAIEATIPRHTTKIEESSDSDEGLENAYEAPHASTAAIPEEVTAEQRQDAQVKTESALQIPRPVKKIKFTAIDAIRVENTPEDKVSPEDWHKYHKFKKKQAEYSPKKDSQLGEAAAAGAPPPSWNIDGTKYSVADDPSIQDLGNGIFGIIPKDITLQSITMIQFQNALAKGFARREKGENGIKFVEKSVIELKISSEMRLFTEKKYVSPDGMILLVFDRVGNHAKVKTFAHENDSMLEIQVPYDISEAEAAAGAAADLSYHHVGDDHGGAQKQGYEIELAGADC